MPSAAPCKVWGEHGGLALGAVMSPGDEESLIIPNPAQNWSCGREISLDHRNTSGSFSRGSAQAGSSADEDVSRAAH